MNVITPLSPTDRPLSLPANTNAPIVTDGPNVIDDLLLKYIFSDDNVDSTRKLVAGYISVRLNKIGNAYPPMGNVNALASVLSTYDD